MSVADVRELYVPGAELEHGWAPATPLADTVARRMVHALAGSTAKPAAAMGARVLRSDDVIATDLHRDAGYWNAAVVLRPLGERSWEQLVGQLEAFAAASEVPRRLDVWSPFPTPDLRHRGWRLSGHPVAMWRPAGPRQSPAPTGLDVREIRTSEEVRLWAEAAAAWFPLSSAPADVADISILDDRDVHLFIAWAAGEPVALSSAVVTAGTNALPFVAVRPDARGRGYGEAATWTATQVRPDLPAALLASDEGRPVYERMGYLPLQRWTLWLVDVPGSRPATDG